MLKNRVAVVTGAGRGIGRAVAELFISEGARVVVNDLDLDVAQETVRACEAIGGKACAVLSVGSVTDSAYCESLMKRAFDTFGAHRGCISRPYYLPITGPARGVKEARWRQSARRHLGAR